ncbi:MAG: pyruvate kinase [Candidatus Zixiibacteriota bacterium]|nr:MAG: pyruvate kinase [candidate division Zixibacteria bacterium]
MKKNIATKIIATLGPASSSKSIIKKLAETGVDIFRLNLSHGDFASHDLLIKNIRGASRELKIRTGIMIDIPGPKIRIGKLSKDPFVLKRGERIYLKSAAVAGNENFIPVDFRDIHKIVQEGTSIFINDGAVKLIVKKISNHIVECRVDIGGEIGSRKGINIPGGKFAASAITGHDKECVKFGIEHNVDFFAMSFVRKAADLETLRRLVKREKGSQFLISKIEKPEAIDDFDNILSETDGIMLARGDLGIEIPIEKVPIVQKRLLAKCNYAGVPVITATQVLDSMVKNPRPTRAEAADAANAILDKTDALMLSQETAIGKYPVETVRTLRNIIYEAEKILEPGGRYESYQNPTIADSVARSVVETARDLNIKTIVTPTRSGHTARLISRYRPGARILAISDSQKAVNDLTLSWGVDSILMDHRLDLAVLINKVRNLLLKEKYAGSGEKFIITSGSPLSEAGETNVMLVETV